MPTSKFAQTTGCRLCRPGACSPMRFPTENAAPTARSVASHERLPNGRPFPGSPRSTCDAKHGEETMTRRTLGASTVLIISVVAANAQAPNPAQPVTPRDADGHPSLAGLWNGPDPSAPPNIARQGADFRDFL